MTGRQTINKRRQKPKRRARENGHAIKEMAKKVLPSLLVVAIVVGIPFLSYQAYLFAITSPSFAITEIEVSGAEHMTSKQVMEVGQISPGVNIFDVEEERVAEAIKKHEWIKDAHVSTRLPGTLLIEVKEHEPVALIMDEGNYYLLDDGARPFRTLLASELTVELLDALPLLSGLQKARLEEEEEERARVLEAMHVWELWHERGLQEIAPISEVHLDEVLGLSLVVGAQGTEVRLGWGQWAERLERFAIVYQDLLDRGVAVDYVLIDQDGDINRVAVGPDQARER